VWNLSQLSDWWGVGMVICQERGADLHTAQLIPLPLTVSCFSKIQIGFIFIIPAHPGSPGQRAVKRVCVYQNLTWASAGCICTMLCRCHSCKFCLYIVQHWSGCSVMFVRGNLQLFADKSSKFGSLPSCLRRAMTQKFPDFDQYQLGELFIWLPRWLVQSTCLATSELPLE